MVLAGANNYTGTTHLVGGNLAIGSLAPIGSGQISFEGGLLKVLGTSLTNVDSRVSNYGSFNGGFNIANAANSFTVNSVVGGTNGFIKDGPGKLTLTNANTYIGITDVLGGRGHDRQQQHQRWYPRGCRGDCQLNGTNNFTNAGNTISGVLSLAGSNNFTSNLAVATGGVVNSSGASSFGPGSTIAGTANFTGATTFNGGFTVNGGLAVVTPAK